ncbi:unnamed protein product, partial [Prorocentrum cordatum]
KVMTKCSDEDYKERTVQKEPAETKRAMKRIRKIALKKPVLRPPSDASVRKRPPAAAARKEPSAAAIKKQAKYRSKSKAVRRMHHNHGWPMVLTPEGRIMAAIDQQNPEGNGVAAVALTRALEKHPNVITFVYDGCCSFYGINTQVAEQSFSWFRAYARPLNEMVRLSNKFLVLSFAKLHGAYVEDHNFEYMPP